MCLVYEQDVISVDFYCQVWYGVNELTTLIYSKWSLIRWPIALYVL